MKSIFDYQESGAFNGKKRIIFGCFQSAREFAVRLLNQDIYFDMFLYQGGEETYCLPNILNKKVICIEECKKMSDFVILVSFFELQEAKEMLSKYNLSQYIFEIEQLSSDICKSQNLVVYGTGGRAKRFYHDICSNLDIHYFCDSNESKAGSVLYSIPVISPSDLSDCPKDTVVLIASTYMDEIYNTIVEYGMQEDKIYVVNYECELLICVKQEARLKIAELRLHAILHDIKGRRAVIYGEEGCVHAVVRKLGLLDVACGQAVSRKGIEEDGTVWSLLYLDSDDISFIIADSYSKSIHKSLLDMGIQEKNIIWLENYTSFYVTNKTDTYISALDPNMGHAYLGGEEEYPGFICYKYLRESSDKRPVRIVTLGGSTTSGYGAKHATWSKCLSDLLRENGIPHVLYCGGVDAYSASQELMKLIRDGVWIKPDLVISYGGANNMVMFKRKDLLEYPFISSYQAHFFDKAAGLVKMPPELGGMKQINRGVQAGIEDFEYWYTQLRMMYGVCTSLNIRYKAFLQPVLLNKQTYFEPDGEIAVLLGFLFDREQRKYTGVNADFHYRILHHNALQFRNAAKRMQEPWFYDLSDIFEEQGGVYMDWAHVYTEGNFRIAQKIYEMIQQELDEICACIQDRRPGKNGGLL